MRTKKPSALLVPTMFFQVAGHAAMGVAFGLGFAFVVTHIAQLGAVSFIDHSAAPQDALMTFVVTCVTTFGIGTTLTGLVLATMNDSE